MRELKKNVRKARIDPNMEDDDDFDLEEPKVQATKLVRLSELDCAKLTLEELEYIDRSKNYVLPNAAKLKVEEYRKVYSIPSPEEEKKERQEAEREWREKRAKEAWERNAKRIQEEKNKPAQKKETGEPSLDVLKFDFAQKYNKTTKPTD